MDKELFFRTVSGEGLKSWVKESNKCKLAYEKIGSNLNKATEAFCNLINEELFLPYIYDQALTRIHDETTIFDHPEERVMQREFILHYMAKYHPDKFENKDFVAYSRPLTPEELIFFKNDLSDNALLLFLTWDDHFCFHSLLRERKKENPTILRDIMKLNFNKTAHFIRSYEEKVDWSNLSFKPPTYLTRDGSGGSLSDLIIKHQGDINFDLVTDFTLFDIEDFSKLKVPFLNKKTALPRALPVNIREFVLSFFSEKELNNRYAFPTEFVTIEDFDVEGSKQEGDRPM